MDSISFASQRYFTLQGEFEREQEFFSFKIGKLNECYVIYEDFLK